MVFEWPILWAPRGRASMVAAVPIVRRIFMVLLPVLIPD